MVSECPIGGLEVPLRGFFRKGREFPLPLPFYDVPEESAVCFLPPDSGDPTSTRKQGHQLHVCMLTRYRG